MIFNTPVSTENLIPHRSSMQFIKTLYACEEDNAETTVKIEDNIFLNSAGELDCIALVEFLAQLSAAHFGYKAGEESLKIGFLVGVDDFEIYDTVFKNEELKFSIKITNFFPPVSFISGRVIKGEKEIAKGTIKIYQQTVENSDLPQLSPLSHKVQGPVTPEREFVINNVPGSLLNKAGSLDKEILNSLLRLECKKEDGKITADLFFNKNFLGFIGHFPGHPILSGVIMLKMGKLITELYLKSFIQIATITNVKFAKIIFPEQPIRLQGRLFKDTQTVEFKLYCDSELCAKFSFVFTKKEQPV